MTLINEEWRVEKSKNSINVEGEFLFCGGWNFSESVSVGSTFIRDESTKTSVVATIFLKSRFFLKLGFLKSRFHCILVIFKRNTLLLTWVFAGSLQTHSVQKDKSTSPQHSPLS